MTDQHTFRGLYTAIVTPFDQDKKIDKPTYEKHLKFQVDGGVDGIVVCGTTGESPTYSDKEFEYLVATAVEIAGDSCQIIAGSGSNATGKSVKRSKIAENVGADGLLIVGPYYNKPTQEGIKQHYRTIADAVSIPSIVYNVPGRTAVNIATDTIAELAEHPNISAAKEASGDINQIMDLVQAVPEDFSVLSGDDAMTLPLIAVGGRGVISVAANQVPAIMKELVANCLADNMDKAREFHYKLLPLMRANFWESNPIPVKTSLALMGRMQNEFRLPLVPLSKELEGPIKQLLEDLGAM